MPISGIGGQSGFYPAQAAAQYAKNAYGGSSANDTIGQAKKETAAEKYGALGGQALGEMPSGGMNGGGKQKAGVAEEPSANSVIYDPRDTNGDGKVSLQEELAYEESSSSSAAYDPRDTNRDGKVSLLEELAYAAKQYSARRGGENKFAVRAEINRQEPQNASVSVMA